MYGWFVILLQQFTDAAAPDVVQLMLQTGAYTQWPPLVQYPVDIRGHVTREVTLLFCKSKPAGDEEVFLRFRAYQPVLSGQLQCDKCVPCQMTGLIPVSGVSLDIEIYCTTGCFLYIILCKFDHVDR